MEGKVARLILAIVGSLMTVASLQGHGVHGSTLLIDGETPIGAGSHHDTLKRMKRHESENPGGDGDDSKSHRRRGRRPHRRPHRRPPGSRPAWASTTPNMTWSTTRRPTSAAPTLPTFIPSLPYIGNVETLRAASANHTKSPLERSWTTSGSAGVERLDGSNVDLVIVLASLGAFLGITFSITACIFFFWHRRKFAKTRKEALPKGKGPEVIEYPHIEKEIVNHSRRTPSMIESINSYEEMDFSIVKPLPSPPDPNVDYLSPRPQSPPGVEKRNKAMVKELQNTLKQAARNETREAEYETPTNAVYDHLYDHVHNPVDDHVYLDIIK